MKFTLTAKYQFNKRGKDGKSRNYLYYFLNGIQILRQKYPFNTDYEYGLQARLLISEEYLLNGNLYQTRYDIDKLKERHVKYPISKKKLVELMVPNDLKINISNEKQASNSNA